MEAITEASLPALFQRALQTCEAAETRAPSSSEETEAVACLTRCETMIASLGLFSTNEDADDVATKDLKYLLAPYLLAATLARTPQRDRKRRRSALEDARAAYARFLQSAEDYGLVPPDAHLDEAADAATLRERKIARFRLEKAARAKLAALQGRMLESRRAAQLNVTDEAPEGDDTGEREAWLARLELAVLRAAEQMPLLKQESEVLRHASSLPEGQPGEPPPPPPQDLLDQLRSAVTALQSRDEARAAVFRPSHILPTRTLREQAAIETEQASRAAAAQARSQRARAAAEADEDAQLARQRAWDDWKDDHPRGAGNSRLKPTA